MTIIFTPRTTLTASLSTDDAKESRIVEGLIIPWNESGHTSTGMVTAKRGSIAIPKNVKHVKLFRNHTNELDSQPVGYATSIEDTEEGLLAKFYVADTHDGDVALKDITEGIRDALSVELINHDITGDSILAAELSAVALVPIPAFSNARVTKITAASAAPKRVVAPAGISAKPREATLTASAVYDALTRLDDPRADQTLLTAALKSMTTAKSPLEFAPQWVGHVWEGAAYARQFIPAMTQRTLTDLKLVGYKWKNKPEVAAWTGAGAEVHSANAGFEVVEVEATRLAGANKLPLEWVHFHKTELIAAYFDALAEDYAIKSDNEAFASVLAAATEEDKTASQFSVLKAIAYANKKVKKTTRVDADVFCVNDEDYFNLIDLKEKELPALLSLVGVAPENLRPTDQLPAGKVLAWHKSAVEHAELPGCPIRVNALDVAKGQTDEGVFGYHATFIGRPDTLAYVKFAG